MNRHSKLGRRREPDISRLINVTPGWMVLRKDGRRFAFYENETVANVMVGCLDGGRIAKAKRVRHANRPNTEEWIFAEVTA